MYKTLGRHSLLVCCALLISAWPIAAQDNVTAVANQIIGGLTKAWETHDGTAYAAQFWPDAEFVNVFGHVMEGQQEIESTHERLLKGPLKNRKTLMTLRKVRQLDFNVIVADTIDTDPSGATQAETRLKLILERRNNTWRIMAAQSTRVSAPSF
jgi:uncharacterized protein (TIGR02246 family)